jgi:hypothetical protein
MMIMCPSSLLLLPPHLPCCCRPSAALDLALHRSLLLQHLQLLLQAVVILWVPHLQQLCPRSVTHPEQLQLLPQHV